MKFKKNLAKFAVLSVLVFTITTGFSYGQRLTGNIRGTVTDEGGIPLPGVTIELSSPVLMGGVHSQITSERGGYRFAGLPPGLYKLVFTLEGFQTIERQKVKIMLGGTVTENIIMKQAVLEETITITGKAPIIDVTKSGISTSFDKDLLEKIPSGRFTFLDVIKQTPGIVTEAGYIGHGTMATHASFSAFGSNEESNSFQIDGLDMSNPRIGTPLLLPNQDLFAEVEVTGIGAPAEYGSFTGVVVNVVTKSGGNTFSGSLGYYGQFQALTDDNNPDPENLFSFNRHKFLDTVFTLGGPILKDKLWFFASVNFTRDDITGWQTDPQYHAVGKEDNYFFKLSSQITNAHRLVGVFSYRDWGVPGIPRPTIMPEAVEDLTEKIPNWNVMYTWLINPNAYLQLKLSGYRADATELPNPEYGGSLDKPIHVDLYTGVQWNGAWWPKDGYFKRLQAQASLAYFAEEFLGGSHDFKIGVQYNRGDKACVAQYSGGMIYWDYNGENYLLYKNAPFYYGGKINNTGVFFDDSWSIGERLTVNLGFRYDNQRGHVPEYPVMDGWNKTSENNPAHNNLIVWNTFSPRIGLVFQLTPDKKTILKAHYGRYYDSLFTGTYEWPGPNNTDWFYYYWTGTEWELYNYVSGEKGWSAPPGLKSPFSDTYLICLEREVLPDFSVGLMGVYKNQKNSIAIQDIGGIYEQVPMVSPDNGETYMVYNQLNVGVHEFTLANPEGFEQTYKGITLNVTKKYSNNWLFNASLTWSRNEGLNCHSPGGGQNAVIALGSYNYGKDPNDWINMKGLLQKDRKWSFKLQFAYNFPWDILASVNYQHFTGLPYASRIRVYPAQGRRRIFAEPRSDKNRFDPVKLLDLRLQKTINLYNRLRFSAIVDVFNLLNIDTATGFYSSDMWSINYLVPRSMPAPRRVQIGLKLEF